MRIDTETLKQMISIAREPATYKDVKDLLRLAADSTCSQTLRQIAAHDQSLDQEHAEYRAAEKKYLALNLDRETKDIIEDYIARKEEYMYDHSTDSYLAGILDGYRILKEFGLTKE